MNAAIQELKAAVREAILNRAGDMPGIDELVGEVIVMVAGECAAVARRADGMVAAQEIEAKFGGGDGPQRA